MSPPTLDQFLGEIAGIIKEKNGSQLQAYLIYEPPLPPLYDKIVAEIKQFYPPTSQKALENKCISFIPEYDDGDEGGSRTSFVMFMVKYFAFLRDVNVDNLIETHDLLKALLKWVVLLLFGRRRADQFDSQSILALSSSIGVMVLPTVVSLSRTLARLAIGLDKRPDLIEHLIKRESVMESEATERVTLVESSANVIREAFKKCLSERSGPPSGIDSNGKPEGRRIGIYVMANLCLKLFFHCRKLRSAEQIFGNIYQQSPPLGLFPAAQRVTYLYYLGRYLFANNHFYRAQLALQAAYDQCHSQCISQRRLILIYLTTSNIILGRFPSSQLLQRPEAATLAEKFGPICTAIAKGDLASFRRYMDLDAQNADWFLRKRILLQIMNRGEILVWRSLARRTFLLSGSQGAVTAQGDVTRKAAPTLSLHDMLTLATFLEKKIVDGGNNLKPNGLTNGHSSTQRSHTNAIFIFPKAQSPPPQEADVEAPYGYVDPDLADVIDPEPPLLPNMEIVESIIASLIGQGLLHGFISHAQHRFAITGVKEARPVQVGFPRVWNVINTRADQEVPGWVKERKAPAFGPGMVVNLSGARPAGAAPG